MQKVITINGYTNAKLEGKIYFTETEYPYLQKLLNDGYNIVDKIVITTGEVSSYAVVFILDNGA